MRNALIVLIITLTTAFVSCDGGGDVAQNQTDAASMHRDTSSMQSPDNDMRTEAGRQLFEKKCRDCHGTDGTQLSKANLRETVLDSLSIAHTIKNGRKDMPGFLDMPDSEVHHITLFVLSLKQNG